MADLHRPERSNNDPRPDTGRGHEPRRAPSQRRESFFVRFAREYGWRAYAIPVLAVITVFVLVDVFRTPVDTDPQTSDTAASTAVSTAPTAAGETSSSQGSGPDPAKFDATEIDINNLPPGSPFTEQGEGTYRIVGTPGLNAGEGTEQTTTYVVEVEDGVNTAGYGGDDAFAAMVDATLSDPRGWTNDPRFRFEHVGPDDNPDMRIQLTSVGTTAQMCGASLEMETSCRTTLGGGNTVVINEARWVRGAAPFEGDLGGYRQYLINHEVGHGIGFAEHVPCGENGELAPIMMQQTLSVSNSELNKITPEVYPDDQKTCRANPWPFPRPQAL